MKLKVEEIIRKIYSIDIDMEDKEEAIKYTANALKLVGASNILTDKDIVGATVNLRIEGTDINRIDSDE